MLELYILIDQLQDVFLNQFTDSRKRIFFLYIFSAFVISFIWLKFFKSYRYNEIVNKIFDRKVYFSLSAFEDYFLAIINQLIMVIISPYLLTQLILATFLFNFFHKLSFSPHLYSGLFSNLTIAILFSSIFFILDDFARFYVHRLLHKISFFWVFHKVHHSARTLNPLTVYRTHPVEGIIFSIRGALVQGLLISIFVFLFGSQVDLITIYSANIFAFIFNIAGSNLRHTNIEIKYYSFIEKIFISPYQHQIHHSSLPEHHDKNYGVVFSIWDNIFGTLILSKKVKEVRYGLFKDAFPEKLSIF